MLDRGRKISAIVIAFNEEADIARALDSVAWCDEVLVVDSGSTDRTVEICEAHGCLVLYRKFEGYGEQKAFAVAQAAHDWILVVDADEEVSPALRDEIRSKLEKPGFCHGYTLPITTVLWDQVVRMGRRHTKAKLRLFDRRFGKFREQLVHESVSVDGPVEPLHQPMYNYSYASIKDYFDKFNQYTSLAARESFARGTRPRLLGIIVRLPLTFIQLYLIKGFIHDGATGLKWSLFSSFYPAVKEFKILELSRAEAARKLAQDSPATSAGAERQPQVRQPRAPSGSRRDWKALFAKVREARATPYVTATCNVALAVLLIKVLQREEPVDDFLLLLAAVVATARFLGFGPSLLATAMGVLCLDFFVLAPEGMFVLPNLEGLIQLSLFTSLALLSSSLVYARRRNIQR